MIPPSDEPVAGPVPPPPVLPAPDLSAMRATFIADFVGGRIGRQHNTFQHRARVLRQLTHAQALADAGAAPALVTVPAQRRGH